MRRIGVPLAAALAVLVWAGRPEARVIPAAPAGNFVVVSSSGTRWVMALRSAATGRVEKVLGTFGSSFTDNGLALSPDGRDVYFTLIGSGSQPPLLVRRLSVATARQTFIADGQEPAVSPDGRRLAYTTGEFGRHQSTPGLAVRDLRSGRTLSIDLTRTIGRGRALLVAPTAWLSGGSDVAVLSGPRARRVSGARAGAAASLPLRLILIHVGPRGLAARSYPLPGTALPVLGADPTGPHSVLLAGGTASDQTIVERITPGPSSVTVTPLLTVRAALPVAWDPSGRHLLYLQGLGPDLMSAGIGAGALTDPRRLIRNARIAAAAW